jgi:riboflavin biosynthesis pyrimidine reductase
MVTTIDGKILPDRWGKIAGPKSSTALFEDTAASFGIGAWVVGTTTLKEFSHRPFKLPATKGAVGMQDFIAKPDAKTLAIGVDTTGQTFWKSNEVDGDHVVLLITQQTTRAYRAHLRAAGVSYLVCGKEEVDLKLALDKLARAFKLKKLMIQGGGKMNGSFLREGLIDEISQVIVPIVDGGMGISGFFDIIDPPAKAAAHLRQMSYKKLPGGVNWFRYRVL